MKITAKELRIKAQAKKDSQLIKWWEEYKPKLLKKLEEWAVTNDGNFTYSISDEEWIKIPSYRICAMAELKELGFNVAYDSGTEYYDSSPELKISW